MYAIRAQLSRFTERRKRRPWRRGGLGRAEMSRMLSTDSKTSEDDLEETKGLLAVFYATFDP